MIVGAAAERRPAIIGGIGINRFQVSCNEAQDNFKMTDSPAGRCVSGCRGGCGSHG
jgi:hypothetical protein